ncbi:hypothetical protein KC19_8G072200 [Ceratodon purpureus]|uniref:Uncharacterized protein n=1 Tax=Ceratodon purpureus TaxID=3225 RepID=A0A8T0H1M0_CERPU|nr:hypothetical protein KC19_8G072200 [Ceratodon purpureus]
MRPQEHLFLVQKLLFLVFLRKIFRVDYDQSEEWMQSAWHVCNVRELEYNPRSLTSNS